MEQMVQMSIRITLKQGYHAPMLLLDATKAKAPIILEVIPNEHEEKLMYFYHAGIKGKRFSDMNQIGNLNKVFYICEAWMGTNIHIRPSTDPKRIEALLICCLD